MEKKHLTLPNQKNYQHGLDIAFKLAGEKLASINLEEQCKKSGATLKTIDCKEVIFLDYLGNSYCITLPEIGISSLDKQKLIQPREKLLMLHYFINADGSLPSGQKITYKEIPDGATYFPTFYKRAIKPFVDWFANKPKDFIDIAAELGGTQADYGDSSVEINVFKRVPLIFVLWNGDDELHAEGGILFDSNITGYLSSEDITVVCEIIAWTLVKLLRELKNI